MENNPFVSTPSPLSPIPGPNLFSTGDKWLWPVVIGGIILFLVAIGGVWWWMRDSTPTASPTPVSSGWKTYTNEEYKFQFEYPNYLVEKEHSSNWLLVASSRQSDHLAVTISANSFATYTYRNEAGQIAFNFDKTKNEWVPAGNMGGPDVALFAPKRYLTAKGLVTYVAPTSDGGTTSFMALFETETNQLVRIDLQRNDSYKDCVTADCPEKPLSDNQTIYQILDTVKIGIADTSNWKTYRNEQYGFEVRYSTDWRVENSDDPQSQSVSFISTSQDVSIQIQPSKPTGFWEQAPKKEPVNIAGITTIAFVFPDGYECYGDNPNSDACSAFFISFSKNGQWYLINAHGKAQSVSNYSQILSTLKFINYCSPAPACKFNVVYGNPLKLANGCINYACSENPIPCGTPPACSPPMVIKLPEPRPGLPITCLGDYATCVSP